jgi:iron complex transport system ATP-binding protein
MILAVQELSFSYLRHDVLKAIDFNVFKGECLAVLGTNGVGKSTLLKCINRILKPQSGVVYINRNEAAELSGRELARRIGYVAQRQLSTRCTVYDTVLLGRKPHIGWDISAKDLEIVDKVLRLLELEPYALRYIDELSGGELQKVVIARALAQEPGLLLLDEPTSNLDIKNQLEVIDIIKKVVKSQQIAAVVTMHDLNLALRFADKFILLKDGAIFAMGGLEVMIPENLEQVYSVPLIIKKFGDVPVVVPL